MMLYVLQGLFHPARRVREIYWRVYNNMYVYASHSMVAGYPRMENTEKNNYQMESMDVFL